MKKGYKSTCRYNLAKDCFILSFCLMGINSADLYNATEMKGILSSITEPRPRLAGWMAQKIDGGYS